MQLESGLLFLWRIADDATILTVSPRLRVCPCSLPPCGAARVQHARRAAWAACALGRTCRERPRCASSPAARRAASTWRSRTARCGGGRSTLPLFRLCWSLHSWSCGTYLWRRRTGGEWPADQRPLSSRPCSCWHTWLLPGHAGHAAEPPPRPPPMPCPCAPAAACLQRRHALRVAGHEWRPGGWVADGAQPGAMACRCGTALGSRLACCSGCRACKACPPTPACPLPPLPPAAGPPAHAPL